MKTNISKQLKNKARKQGGIAIKRVKNKDGSHSWKERKTSRKSTTSKQKDLQRKGKAPGARLSRSGKVYYESRKNRSDKNPFLKL